MIEQIRALVKLQKIDIEIKKLIEERTGTCEPFEKLKQLHEKSEQKLVHLEEELGEAREKIDKLEALLNVEREKVKKWDQRLKNMKSARDYAAMQREIEIQKRINSEMEDELLKLMEIEEATKTACESEKKVNDELAQNLEEEKKRRENSTVSLVR